MRERPREPQNLSTPPAWRPFLMSRPPRGAWRRVRGQMRYHQDFPRAGRANVPVKLFPTTTGKENMELVTKTTEVTVPKAAFQAQDTEASPSPVGASLRAENGRNRRAPPNLGRR